MDVIDVLKKLASIRGTTLEHEIAEHNADIKQRIASGGLHPELSPEERQARRQASKQRYLDKAKTDRAARKALKPHPTAEELAAKALTKLKRKKATQRNHRVRARDALRALRAKTGRVHGGGPQKGVPVSERRALTLAEKRARKNAGDERYRVAARDALRELRNQTTDMADGSQGAGS